MENDLGLYNEYRGKDDRFDVVWGRPVKINCVIVKFAGVVI